MKHKSLAILAICLVASCYVAYRLCDYYAPAQERAAYQTVRHQDDTLRIAFIGDSWADYHRNHSCLIAQLVEDRIHHPVKVETFGICGLTSKEIYDAMFEIDDFKKFMSKGFDYCIISAGINDTYKKMSTAYYKGSMDCMIHLLLDNHIHPVILEIPDYNIRKAYDRQKPEKKLLRQFSMLINGVPMDCKQQFRATLDELIRKKGYEEKLTVVRYTEWNDHYPIDQERLYAGDGMHLNHNGYAKLDSCIATHIIPIGR